MYSWFMVKHIIKAIFTKPLQILKSIYYRFSHQNQQLAEKRLAICNKCNDRLTFLGQEICGQCGCILENKTRLVNEQCGKWK